MTLSLCPYWRHWTVSQITVICLLPALRIFYIQNIPFCFSMVIIKPIIYISWSFNSHFFILLWLQQICKILKATACQQENGFFLGKLLFLTLTSSDSKCSYIIALKFLVKQINLTRKKSVSVICKIMNINKDFRIFVKVSHSAFLKKC